MSTPSRLSAVVALSLGVALLFVAPSGAIPGEVGDEPAAAPTHAPGVIVVDFTDGVDEDVVRAAGQRAGVRFAYASDVSADEALFVADAPDAAAALAALQGMPEIEAAEPAVEMTTLDGPTVTASPVFGYPDDPAYTRQWSFPLIGAATGWRVGGGQGVVVAVIDTGVSANADLPADRLLPGKSFVPGAATPADDHGHGTHVAGTIAQGTNDGVGAAGLAPNAKILPLKVLSSSGGGRSDWIAAAIDEAVDQGADVINLSLGGGHSDVVVNAVEKARKAGVIVVAAAGNTGRQGIGSPADAPAAIAVSAVGPDDTLTPYSSWGKGVEIAAPGGDTRVSGGGIVQTTIDKKGGTQLAEWQGTSMASPHVAGAAAVLLGAGAGSADEVERLLKTSADPRDDALRFGAGRLDLGAAVRKLLFLRQGLLFLAGGLLTFGLGALGGIGGRRRGFATIVGAGIAGGFFLLPLLPLPPATWLSVLSRPFLAWPGHPWSGFPLWQSAILPFGLAFLLGPSRWLSPVALALCGGTGAYLLYGAATGDGDLWWMPFALDRAWLAVNGTLALVAGMGVAGMQKMRGKE